MTDFNSIEERISAYLDGEMTPEDHAAFEADLETDPELAERTAAWGQTDDLLQALVPEPSDSHMMALMAANTPKEPRWPLRQMAAGLMLFALGGAGGFGLSQISQAPQQILVVQALQDATAAHVMFTAEMRHAVEVGADETAHLETWLAKRMGRTMVVPQLEDFGLTFLGGRMLPFEDRAAAQYMYETVTGERMTLYMARTDDEAQTALRFLDEDGLNTVRWQDGPWVFILVAPLDRTDLTPVAEKVHETLV